MGCFSMLTRKLDEKHLPYNILADSVIEIFQKKENVGSVRVVIGFDDETDNHPWFKCYDLGKFPKEKTAAALIACNNANKEYRWIRFYLDEDQDVVASADAIVTEDGVFNEVIEMIVRLFDIVDAVYPSFMKARWA